ncbi:MAG TPA: GNAT family N-acetyltransferase, partial [Actinomycetes bacterium]
MDDHGPLEVAALAPTDPALRGIWPLLERDAGVGCPFLTWPWFSALADVPSASGCVRVLVATRAGEPIGLLPLEWATGPGRLRTVGPAGWRWLAPDHLDVLGPGRQRLAAARAMLAYLAVTPDWDALDLDGLDPAGALARATAGALRPPRFLHRPAEPVAAPFVDLRAKDDAELFPSRNLRHQVRRGLRAAERSGGGLETVRDPQRVGRLMEELMALHNARFGAASAVFATPERRRFHLLASGRMAAAGMAQVVRLTAEGRTAALLYALLLPGRVFYYAMGMAGEVGLSPGRTVLGQAILAAADEGFSEFDLLRGDHPFKLRFASGIREDLRIRVVRPTVRTLHEG